MSDQKPRWVEVEEALAAAWIEAEGKSLSARLERQGLEASAAQDPRLMRRIRKLKKAYGLFHETHLWRPVDEADTADADVCERCEICTCHSPDRSGEPCIYREDLPYA